MVLDWMHGVVSQYALKNISRDGPPIVSEGVLNLAARMRASFDPSGRLNPGRDPYSRAA